MFDRTVGTPKICPKYVMSPCHSAAPRPALPRRFQCHIRSSLPNTEISYSVGRTRLVRVTPHSRPLGLCPCTNLDPGTISYDNFPSSVRNLTGQKKLVHPLTALSVLAFLPTLLNMSNMLILPCSFRACGLEHTSDLPPMSAPCRCSGLVDRPLGMQVSLAPTHHYYHQCMRLSSLYQRTPSKSTCPPNWCRII